LNPRTLRALALSNAGSLAARRLFLFAFTWASALIACRGTTTGDVGSATVNGTIGGQTVPTADTISIMTEDDQPDGAAGQSTVFITITNVPNICAKIQTPVEPAGEAGLDIELNALGSPLPLPLGPYDIGPFQGAMAAASAEYSTRVDCGTPTSAQATAGTVTITNSTDNLVEGDFDLTFDTGDHLAGTFSAPQCILKSSPYKTSCGS
jgi:hypothetical protein